MTLAGHRLPGRAGSYSQRPRAAGGAHWGHREHPLQDRFVIGVTAELWFPRVKVGRHLPSPSGTETLSFKLTETQNPQYLQMWHETEQPFKEHHWTQKSREKEASQRS